jgi:4-hydroxy-2-oxoheptanedioate aldolase
MKLKLALMLALVLAPQSSGSNPVVELLKQGQFVFGSMVSTRTEAGGAKMGADPNLDFVFYDLEHSDFDIAGLQAFIKGLRSTGARKAVLVRIPPIGNEPATAELHVAQALDAGADGIVFPHIQNRQQAEWTVQWLSKSKRGLWPANPNGGLVSYLMIEDREAVDHAREIVGTKGPTMFAPGQSSLGEAYNRDTKAVEAAIQTILASCKEFKTTCAKLASDADIETRVHEGFHVLMANGDALVKGRKLAGRN